MKKYIYGEPYILEPLSCRASDVHLPIKRVSLVSILSKLRKPSLGLLFFLLGLNGMYFLPMLFPMALRQEAQSGTYRFYMLSWFLIIIGGILETRTSGLWLIRRKRSWAILLLSALVLMTIISTLDSEPLISIFNKSIPFYWLLLVPAIGVQARNWPWLWAVFISQAMIGISFSLYAFFSKGATSRLATIDMEGQNFLSTCLYIAIFMFLMIPMVRGKLFKILILCTFSVELLRTVFFAHRMIWFLLPAIIMMLVYISFRSKMQEGVRLRSIVGLILSFILFISIILLLANSPSVMKAHPVLEQAYQELMNRMLEKGTLLDTILQNERWLEAETVVGTMEGLDWVFGKGLAARWSNPLFARGEERNMVHNTWLNAFYWGGVFLFLALFFPLLWVIRIFLRSYNRAALCYAGFALFIYMKFPSYLITFKTPEWILFCLALGACISYEPALPNRYAHFIRG